MQRYRTQALRTAWESGYLTALEELAELLATNPEDTVKNYELQAFITTAKGNLK